MPKLFVCQDTVHFVTKEEFDVWLVQNILEFMAGLGGVISCGLFRAYEIAFSINLPVFSCAAVHAWAIW